MARRDNNVNIHFFTKITQLIYFSFVLPDTSVFEQAQVRRRRQRAADGRELVSAVVPVQKHAADSLLVRRQRAGDAGPV